MWQLASAIGEIALRRRGPEILPDSAFLVGLLLALNLLLSIVVLLLGDSLNGYGLANFGAQVVLQFAFVFAVLTFFKLERRYLQTMSAFLGVNMIVGLLYVPLAIVAMLYDPEFESLPLFVLANGLLFWIVFVEATIFARSLSQPLILGFMVEILYLIPSLSLRSFFLTGAE